MQTPQLPRVERVGRHALQPEQNQRFQRPHVLIGAPKLGQVVVVGLTEGSFFPLHGGDTVQNSFIVKIDIRDRREQPPQQHLIGAGGGGALLRRPRQPDQRPDERVLIVGGVGLFAADTDFAVAPGIVRGLLALEAEHFLHKNTLPK